MVSLLRRSGKKPLTKYKDNQCKEFAGGGLEGKWQSEGLKAGQTTTVKLALAATLTLRDTKTPLGESGVQCYKGVKGEGVIEVEGKGKIRAFEVEKPKEKCRGKKVCKETEVEEVKGVNLPWNIEIISEGTKIANSGAGEPGWAVKCNTPLGSKTDTCTSENKEYEEIELKGVVVAGISLVEGLFAKTVNINCTEGGKGSGQIEGSTAIFDSKGEGLQFKQGGITRSPTDWLVLVQTATTTATYTNMTVQAWSPSSHTLRVVKPPLRRVDGQRQMFRAHSSRKWGYVYHRTKI